MNNFHKNSNSNTSTPILNYQTIETIYDGTRTLVYRAVSSDDQLPVVIKLLKNEYPTFSELVQFRNQYTIAKNLSQPGIIETYSLEPYKNGYALVMEDFGGVSLKEWAVKGENILSMREFLEIAIALSNILDILYRQRILHKDIKPANILINPETKEVKLIDFSIASLLPRETQTLISPNVLEGTLAYISPEQTGRMNRGIDYRTDFYSLGVTFYELLTGKLPFQSNDPMELVHCHIAKETPLLGNWVEIPQVISDIVMKLMAKNPENRYQSALGLKHDLEFCLSQLNTTGKIEAFEIGKKDICERFIIPEKLYGRETEIVHLLNAFERISTGNTEMMLVAGFSGIGKTAVVHEVHKPITRQRGYFIQGKFDQFNRNIPFSAFVQAFRDLMGQLLSQSDTQLQTWKTEILEALGDNGQVIIEVIPELESIIGQQLAAPELSGYGAQNRFNLLFQKFTQVFTKPAHPLVMFLDDLQWADSASLKLIQLLMSGSETGYLLLIGAYRDNEVFPAHPLMLTLDAVVKSEAMVNTITLQPLSQTSLSHLVADTLNCTEPLAQPLTKLVYQKTQGNPFFATQFLKALHQDGLIEFTPPTPSGATGGWQCDIVGVQEAALTDDVVEFMALQLQKLPAETQEVLKLAACIGNQFDLSTLAIVSEQSKTETAAVLWRALQESLILPQSEIYKFYMGQDNQSTNQEIANPVAYKFLHDRVQQAAYSLIDEHQRQATHYRIGQLLLEKLSDLEQNERLFDLVNQINFGQDLIEREIEREQVAQLNLLAGKKALLSTAFKAAIDYFEIGISLVREDAWIERYDLIFDLYRNLAEAQLSNSSFQELEATITFALERITSPVDRVNICVFQVIQYTLQAKYQEAIQVGIVGLESLGITIERDKLSELIGQEFAAVEEKLENRSIASLIDLPTVIDPVIEAAITLLITFDSPTYIIGDIGLYAFVSLRATYLSIEHGNVAASIKAYANYGLLLGLMQERYQRSYEMGNLALQLSYKLSSRSQQSKACMLLGGWIQVWAKPIAGAANINYEGFLAGVDSGENQFAGYNLLSNIFNLLFQGEHLAAVAEDIEKYWLVGKKDQNELLLLALAGANIFITDLCQERDGQVAKTLISEEELVERAKTSQSWLSLCLYYILKMHFSCLIGNFDRASYYTTEAGKILSSIAGFTTSSSYPYYGSLILLNLYPTLSHDQQSDAKEQVRSNQERLKKWSDSCPENFLHKYLLVEAEHSRLLENNAAAIDHYDRAISGAKANEYIQEEALANELAAKFYLDWGKEKVAQVYMQEAYYCYARWGASSKTDDLEARYPDLLRPILQQAYQPFKILETLTTLQTTPSKTSSSSSINATLDFASLLQIAQAISSTIDLDELLQMLTSTMLQNSGGDRCALMLCQDREWQVCAIADLEGSRLQKSPLENNLLVPVKLIQYVKNTLVAVVIDNLETDDLPVIDDYLQQHQPQSVLGLPILNQGNLVGIVYLENRIASGVFSRDRLLALNFLAVQAAISLENARLYHQVQQTLGDLQQAQLQIVQSEKMSALGNLVAGVAHEINNPIGCIVGNVGAAQDYINDLLNIIDLYNDKFPQPGAEIEDELEAIDLDYVREDLPKLIRAMKDGGDRITSISKSLRTFSRADTDQKQKFNLHEGIDSTILILRHRLKANDTRPAIEVVTNYGKIPAINCFPGQLNQVFMNLLANAIDALEESSQGRSFAEIEANPNCITVCTGLSGDRHIKITIADNGAGMTEEVKQKIFDHLFTTKAVGKGTGLGLAIARQIVVETHGGTIEVNSHQGKGTEFAIVLPVSEEKHS